MVVICAGCPLDAAPGPKIELRSAVIGSFALGDVLDVPGSVTVGVGAVGSLGMVVDGGVPEKPPLPLDGCGAEIGVVVTVTGSVLTL